MNSAHIIYYFINKIIFYSFMIVRKISSQFFLGKVPTLFQQQHKNTRTIEN